MANDVFPAPTPAHRQDLGTVSPPATPTIGEQRDGSLRLPTRSPYAEMKFSPSHEGLHETVERLQSVIRQQEELIQAQAEALLHHNQIFERASVAARIGVWECDLQDDSLTWSDVVYDIFNLPRGSALDRTQTIECYSAESRAALQTVAKPGDRGSLRLRPGCRDHHAQG